MNKQELEKEAIASRQLYEHYVKFEQEAHGWVKRSLEHLLKAEEELNKYNEVPQTRR
jgi:hypothetical protein